MEHLTKTRALAALEGGPRRHRVRLQLVLLVRAGHHLQLARPAAAGVRQHDELRAADDGDRHERGVAKSFLASEEAFRFLKDLETPQPDRAGRRQFRRPARAQGGGPATCASTGPRVSAFYLSNVEQYLRQDGIWSTSARTWPRCRSRRRARSSGRSRWVAAGRSATCWARCKETEGCLTAALGRSCRRVGRRVTPNGRPVGAQPSPVAGAGGRVTSSGCSAAGPVKSQRQRLALGGGPRWRAGPAVAPPPFQAATASGASAAFRPRVLAHRRDLLRAQRLLQLR